MHVFDIQPVNNGLGRCVDTWQNRDTLRAAWCYNERCILPDVLLMQNLLPDTRELFEYYTFQQDDAPPHRARDTVKLLTNKTSDFISPAL